VAGRLAADLRAEGLDVWMAPGSIRPGESFAAAIDRGLEGCEYVAVLLSPAAMASAWVQAEVYAALDRAHRGVTTILPMRLQPVAVPPLLSGFQWIDFSDYEGGLAALAAVLGADLRPVSAMPVVEAEPSPRPTPPPDAFVARVLGALDAGARSFGYAVQRTVPEQGGFLDAVSEVALLRIGILVQRGKKSVGQLLAEVQRELAENPHRVAAVLAVAPGEETTMRHYQLLDAETPNAVVLTWAPASGLDAVPAAVAVVVDLVAGRGVR
jgi:TIR domain